MASHRSKKNNQSPATLLAVVIVGGLALAMPGFGLVLGVVLLIAGAIIGFVSASRSAKRARQWKAIGSYFELSPEAFEQHVAETYELAGYKTKVTPRRGDQGVDVLATRGDETIAIQCKRLSERASNGAVQEVHAGKTHYGCSAAIAVCLGGFTSSAVALAQSTNVALIDGKGYADMVNRLRPEADRRSGIRMPTGMGLVYCACLIVVGFLAIGLDLSIHSGRTYGSRVVYDSQR